MDTYWSIVSEQNVEKTFIECLDAINEMIKEYINDLAISCPIIAKIDPLEITSMIISNISINLVTSMIHPKTKDISRQEIFSKIMKMTFSLLSQSWSEIECRRINSKKLH